MKRGVSSVECGERSCWCYLKELYLRHFTPLHFTLLYYTALHFFALYGSTCHSIALNPFYLKCIALHCIALHCQSHPILSYLSMRVSGTAAMSRRSGGRDAAENTILR